MENQENNRNTQNQNNIEKPEIRAQKLEELLYKLRRARWLHRRASKYYQPRNIMILACSFIVSGSISILSIGNTDSSNKKTLLLIKDTEKCWKTQWYNDNHNTYKAPTLPLSSIFNNKV